MTSPADETPTQDLADQLQRTVLFRGLKLDLLEKLSRAMKVQEYAVGSDIVKQGAESDALYIILRGRCVVLIEDSTTGIQQEITELVELDVVGEMGLLVAEPRTATVRAVEPTRCASLHRNQFNTIIMNAPAVGLTMSQNLAGRLRDQSRQVSFRYVLLSDYPLDPELFTLFPPELLRRHQIVPIGRDGQTVLVAMTRPTDLGIFAELRRAAPGLKLRPYACGLDDYERHYRSHIEPTLMQLQREGRVMAPSGAIQATDIEVDTSNLQATLEPSVVQGGEVIRFLNEILANAVNRAASDIHIEPGLHKSRVRFRLSGQLLKFVEAPGEFHRALVSRIKVLAGIDIAERRRPQDGRIHITIGTRELDLRVNTVPTIHGEKVVMRILDSSGGLKPLSEMVFSDHMLNTMRTAVLSTQGCVLVCGPTGSGKTTTLYSALTELYTRTPDINISTIEDPVEYTVPGITQTPVDASIGVGFPEVLRALLRQDPDVVMIGEMRDGVTAHIALEASLTGHLVLSTLHANSSADAITRLVEMGCKPYLVASALSLVIGQRLVRRICPHCRDRKAYNESTLKHLDAANILPFSQGLHLFHGRGCGHCGGTGWMGRIACFEVLKVTDAVREVVSTQVLAAPLRQAAIQDKAFTSFKQYGAFLLQEGLTTPPEILRQFGS